MADHRLGWDTSFLVPKLGSGDLFQEIDCSADREADEADQEDVDLADVVQANVDQVDVDLEAGLMVDLDDGDETQEDDVWIRSEKMDGSEMFLAQSLGRHAFPLVSSGIVEASHGSLSH